MSLNERNVFDAIFARRSVRAYVEDRDVEPEKIKRLLEAAMAAPSACNLQPWEFIVVTDKARVRAIKDSIVRWGDYNAPLVIVVCGDPDRVPWEGDHGVLDCAAAIENMLIAAPALGLGGVWIGGFTPSAIRDLLNIPDSVVPVGVVYFGYPAEEHEPRTKYLDEAVHWQAYDPNRERRPRPGHIV
ncbi:MAG: nitroreductase family protein [Anaerolineae bacterium]|nr:nitroreductase family protein [Anaerolineae bacterium]